MGIIYGLSAALCWGITDFLVTYVARRIGTTLAMFYIESCGLLAACSLLFVWPGIPEVSVGTWMFIVGISFINLAGTVLFYRALTIGTLALVAPIMSGFAVVTALLAFLAGERPAALPVLGALLLIIGVIVASKPQHTSGNITLVGVREAVGVAIILGIFFWALGFVTPILGALWPVLVMRVVRSTSIFLWMVIQGIIPVSLLRRIWLLVPGAGILDTLGFVMFNFGIRSEYTSIVAALAALMTAVTVLLAWAILRERLSFWQWVGVGVILLGVMLVNF